MDKYTIVIGSAKCSKCGQWLPGTMFNIEDFDTTQGIPLITTSPLICKKCKEESNGQ